VSYGTTFPIDRALTAKLLGFDGPEVNSLDEITNRWEAEADLGFDVAILMNHLSLIAETLILFATPEFGMVKVADQYSTGSSIMPQKKNPDPLEVIKGKTSYAAGMVSGLLSMGKSNFIGFNRDSQWTKYLIMDLVDECLPAPIVMKGVMETLTVNKTVMASWCDKGFIGATSLMEHIIQAYSIPMRNAKVIVEKAIKGSVGQEKVTFSALNQALVDEGLSLPITEAQVADWQNPATIISLTKSFGGPGKKSMKTSLKKLHKKLQKQKSWLLQKQKEKASAEAFLTEYV
jgi:argininosuccinate lyase